MFIIVYTHHNNIKHFLYTELEVQNSSVVYVFVTWIVDRFAAKMAEVCGLDIPPQSDSPITVDVDASNASEEGALSAVAVQVGEEGGGNAAEVKIEEQLEPTRKYKLTFQPPEKKKYILEIKWGDEPIKGSPLHLDLRPPNAKAVTIAEPPAGKLQAGQPIKICFDTSNAGRGEMLSTCKGEDVGDIAVNVSRRDFTNKFDVTFHPPHEDEYVVQVKWMERSIKGSPFKIDLIPVNPNKVKASAPTIPTSPDKPIEMEISTKGAGNAKLTATCMGTIGGKIPVNLKKVAAHDYHLTVKPPERDILSLSVQYGGKHIPNSPFLVNTLPVDASKVKVTEPENAEVRRLVSYKLNTLHAGAGSLSASCKGKKSGPIDVEIKKEGSTNNKHMVSFTPTVSDVYTVAIQWGSKDVPPKDVPGSPFNLSLLLPPDASKVQVGKLHVPSEARADEWVWLDLDCSDAGHGEVTAEAKREDSKAVNVQTEKTDDDKYRLKFKADQAGKYNLSVLYGGSPIPGSPFSNIVILDLSPKPHHVKYLNTEQPERRGRPAVLRFDTEHAGSGKFRARVAGQATGQTEVSYDPLPNSQHIYEVSFTPQKADTYLVDVYWENDPIPDSPFYVKIVYPDEVIVTEPSKDSISLKNPYHYEVDTTNAGPGELTIECEIKGSSDEVEAIKTEDDDDKYTITVYPKAVGVYSLSIFFNKSHVRGSPFEVDLVPKKVNESPTICAPHHVKYLETKQPERRGRPAVLRFDTEHAGSGKFRARVAGQATGQTEVSYDPLPNSQHIYEVSFTPQKADTYLVDVYWENDPIPDSPFYVKIVYPDEVIVTEPSKDSISLKNPYHYEVDTTNAGPGELTIECEIKGSSDEVEAIKTEDDDDKYTITVYPKAVGVYSLSIFFNESHVRGSPFEVDLVPKKVNESPIMSAPQNKKETVIPLNVTPPPSPQPKPPTPEHVAPTMQRMFIGDPFSCVVGKENLEFLGSMTASAVGEKTGPARIVIKRNEEDLPCFFFNPDVADRYTVEIKMNGTLLADNLFIIDYIYPIDASKCVIFGAEGLDKKLPLDEKVTFGVDASRAGNGKLAASVDGSPSAMIDVTSTEENPHIYHISYVPTVGGTHKINLLWAGEPISKSPIILDIDSGDIPTFYVNKPFVIHFTTDCDAKKIESYAIHEDTYHRYVLKIGKRKQGKLNLILYAKQPGIHSVHILIDGKEIHGSPFKVLFVEADPSACRIIDMPKKPLVGEETSFKVDTKKAGHADLHIKASVPCGGKTDVTHIDHKNGLFSITFTPKVVGDHSFRVSWGGVEIPDSPIKLRVLPDDPATLASKKAASKVYIVKERDDKSVFNEEQSVSNPAFFKLCTKEAGKGQLDIQVRGPVKAGMKVNMVDQAKAIYGCTVRPRASGRYLVSILWNGFSIPDSPFQLNFTGDKTYMINKLNLETDYFTIGSSEDYIIDCGKHTGKLNVKCHPESAAQVEISPVQERDNTYMCKITPQNAGNHIMHVTYDDRDILDSPYVVQFYDADHHDHERDRSGEDEEEERLSSLGSLNLGEIEEIPEISTSPKPAMVKAHGFGLKGGYAGQEGNFTIETAEAGDGELKVEVSGPKDTFKLSMRHHPDSDRKILARFVPKLAGDYTINITWSDTPIPGSPFVVGIMEQRPVIYSIDL